jgi:hypothetical protein
VASEHVVYHFVFSGETISSYSNTVYSRAFIQLLRIVLFAVACQAPTLFVRPGTATCHITDKARAKNSRWKIGSCLHDERTDMRLVRMGFA